MTFVVVHLVAFCRFVSHLFLRIKLLPCNNYSVLCRPLLILVDKLSVVEKTSFFGASVLFLRGLRLGNVNVLSEELLAKDVWNCIIWQDIIIIGGFNGARLLREKLFSVFLSSRWVPWGPSIHVVAFDSFCRWTGYRERFFPIFTIHVLDCKILLHI